MKMNKNFKKIYKIQYASMLGSNVGIKQPLLDVTYNMKLYMPHKSCSVFSVFLRALVGRPATLKCGHDIKT